MRAVTLSGFGGPEVMSWTTVDDPPPPGPGQIAIGVVATAVNRADLLQRQGFYPPPPGASPILGLECSGRVAAVGPGVDEWSRALRSAQYRPLRAYACGVGSAVGVGFLAGR